MMKRNLFSTLALGISLIALCFSMIKITPFPVGGEAFIGSIAAFIGISVTLLVGYQIVNVLEIKKDLKDIRKTKSELKALQARIATLDWEVQGNLDMIAARFLSFNQGSCVDAFLKQQGVLILALKAHKTDFPHIFTGLREFITQMEPGYFATGTNKEIDETIAQYAKQAKTTDSQIRKSTRYYAIRYEYEYIMKCFYTRLENARQGQSVSPEEYKEIWRK